MQINNSNQLNFKSVAYETNLKSEIQEILKKRIKPKKLASFMDRLEKSPVEATFGLADGSGYDRLDIQLYYKSPYITNPKHSKAFVYIEEKKRFNFFHFRPSIFMNKILSKLNTIEETYQIGQYAK